MPDYKAPLKEINFVLNEVLDVNAHYESLEGAEDLTPDLLSAIIEGGAQFAEGVAAPCNRDGDEIGCTWSPEGVTTPPGYKEAYQQFVEGGWPSLSGDPEFGGQGLPSSIAVFINEMTGSANWAWSMYPGLSHGAVATVDEHGSPAQKAAYLPKLLEGTWTGTMCLTEPHCGSDLGMLRTKAVKNADGTYAITGTKIFISSGEHDMAENIVHMVIARVEGAPEGTKGISLFIVPKVNVDAEGNLLDRNGVSCGSIEHKMGIHGNSTCVMNFDSAKGVLVGEGAENIGLRQMFTFMNAARLGTATQGLSHGEAAFQGGLAYAKERLQMRSLTGPKNPDGPADPIIVHPDVRRMLLTQKSLVEASRVLVYWCATLVDKTELGKTEEERKEADGMLAFLTPIAKAFITETGFENANIGVQLLGGHGFIREHGMEQIVRDARISMLYEGTTGIQALDLIGRKVLGTGGTALMNFTKVVHEFAKANDTEAMAPYLTPLKAINKQWGELTMQIGAAAGENPDEAGSASVDYLMYSGYAVFAYIWAKMAKVAQDKLEAGEGDAAYYEAKLKTANFYFSRILPRTESLATTMVSGADVLMAMDEEEFYF
ncbi:3-methylmercaptopropionyl-CoA dehydrogenase [Sinobacterium norvegicum]|uniref:3-methylmercaptopropionyl-CoA dehydrogenase n=1 Tax=Sinobacterium norvegicum TaxID=1641715 RepID=A0ABN8EHJ1_9GAMM|nr:acyl-CoA dehydrogenase C-terminal domain-containing protein [Sinobacterium norvegicum]CAH0991908.1 3-methylmercaptopropionyl-CoA dehydrogenase [Sinobacterium norvegicum]